MPKRRTSKTVLAKDTPSRLRSNHRAGPKAPAYGPSARAFGGDEPAPPDVVSQGDPSRSLAPRPLIDKYPIIVGAGLTFAYLAAVQRIALTGYRMQYVDLMREILERDPNLYANVWKTILGIANGRLEITPVKLPAGDPDTERAKTIADDVARRVERIRGLKQSIANLGWGAFYGVALAENHYAKDRRDGSWLVTHLGFVHSRRLAYPDSQSWDLYIWDQGQVSASEAYGQSPTNSNLFGLRVADWPHKFIAYAPQISGDYPTREGSGRLVGEWALIKRANARNALVYLEQFAKPIPEVTYNTADADADKPVPREAGKEDVQEAQAAAAALATGSLASWTHPDSLTLKLNSPEGANSKVTFRELNDLCNEEESKAVVGSTLTSGVGQHGGNRALGEVHKTEEQNVLSFLADTMSEALREQLVAPLTLLNHPDAAHLIPQCHIHVEDEDPKALLALAKDASGSNVPVDADAIGNKLGLPLVPKPADVKSRMMLPLDLTAPAELDPELTPEPGPGTKAGAQLETDRKQAEKPPAPIGAPGGQTPKPGSKNTRRGSAPKEAKP